MRPCSNCSYQNQDDARFCQNCGRSLARRCPNCQTENPAEAKFCLNCGFRLQGTTDPPPDKRLERLAAAAPRPLVEKMRSPANLGGERRIVTSLFADVVGSTSLAEQMDAEDWSILMNRAFDRLVPVIYRYEGTLARLMGDALLAFFGAPVAHEDDPVRAVHAALDLISTARQFAEEVRHEFGVDFALRVGLNTGPVVVGEVGSNLIYEYTAMGDAVNLAARMQAAARPMTVLITENTSRFVWPIFDCTDLGPIPVKGKAEPVRAYEVVGLKTEPGNLRGLPGLSSPMVGRDTDLDALLDTSSALEAGFGRIVLMIGEAGLGKSRLLAEWKERFLASTQLPLWWIEGRCLSYGQGLAYQLIIDVLSSQLGLTEEAEEAEKHAALKKMLAIVGGQDLQDIYPPLGHLLSLNLEGEALQRMQQLDPPAIQAQYLSATRKLLQALSISRPVILVLEDIHWADPSSVGLLSKLLPIAGELRLLLCFVTRPERDSHGWKIVSAARQTVQARLLEINLAALTDDDSCRLVTNLLKIDSLPLHIRELILRKAEGNPFFVEEVIRVLIEQNVIEQTDDGWVVGSEKHDIEIPDTLQGLLLSRIDRLPEDARHVLRVASVIGRRFPISVLKRVMRETGQEGGVTAPLNQLESLGLLQLGELQPEPEYVFRHAFIQDVAYSSLMKLDRQRLHREMGETMEQIYPDRLTQLAPRLAEHFNQAGDVERALHYYITSGNAAADVYANAEAVLHFSCAIEMLFSNPTLLQAETERLVQLFARKGRALELIGRYTDALETYDQMEEHGSNLGQPKMELEALMARATIYATPTSQFNLHASDSLTERALKLARQLDDQAAEARIYWNLLLSNFFAGNIPKAAEYGEKSLALARKLELDEQLAYILSDMGNYVYASTGNFERGREFLDESIEIWRTMGNKPMLADTLSNLSEVYYFWGDFNQSLSLTDEAFHISEAAGNLWGQAYSTGLSFLPYMEQGEIDEALACFEKSLSLADEAGFMAVRSILQGQVAFYLGLLGVDTVGLQYAQAAVESAEEDALFWLVPALGSLALLQTMQGELEAADATLKRAFEIGIENSRFVFDMFVILAHCELGLARHEYDHIVSHTNRFLVDLRQRNARAHIPYALYYQGRALWGQGDQDAARASLLDAYAEAEAVGSRIALLMIQTTLAELSLQQGNQSAIQVVCLEGRRNIDYLTSRISRPDILEAFRSQERMRLFVECEA